MNTPIQQVPVAKPVLDEREVEAVRRVILSGWVTQGPEVAAFEREFADLVGAPHACAVSNCTTALHLALMAVGVGPALIEPAITPRTKAILCVHQLGMPCDLSKIVEIGKRYGIPVIEDAACAIGSEILWNGTWEKIGKPHGDIACFSFHPRKVITTGDGGMLTTRNPEYDAKFRLWRQHSMSVTDAVRHGSRAVIYETYPELGYNYRLTDMQAAVGRAQLGRLPEIVAQRRQLAETYNSRLSQTSGLVLPQEPHWARSNWQSYCVGLPQWSDQRETMQALLDAGISTRRGVMNIHLEGAYTQSGGFRAGSSLQRSVEAQFGSLILPLFTQMTDDDLTRVADTLAAVVGDEELRQAQVG